MKDQLKNIFHYQTSIQANQRANLKNQKPLTIWFTGLSGAGKSTIANLLEQELLKQKKHTFLLDGDNVRQGLCQDLGFSKDDRTENVRRCAHVAKLMNDAGLIVLSAFISPQRQQRKMIREIIGNENILMVYVKASFETCQKRDVKGLYKKAASGEIKNFTGMGSDYEVPQAQNLTLDTENNSAEECVKVLLEKLKSLDI